MARARLDPEARRTQLVEIAYQLLHREGLETMSAEHVADAAGVSRSLVYTYFGDRDGLVAEVYLRVLADLDAALAQPLRADRATLARLVGACMRFARERPVAWRLLATDSVRRHATVVQARQGRVGDLARGQGNGSGDRLVADAVLGLLEAGIWHWVEHSDLPEDRAAQLLAEFLWSGLAGQGTPSREAQPDGRTPA